MVGKVYFFYIVQYCSRRSTSMDMPEDDATPFSLLQPLPTTLLLVKEALHRAQGTRP